MFGQQQQIPKKEKNQKIKLEKKLPNIKKKIISKFVVPVCVRVKQREHI